MALVKPLILDAGRKKQLSSTDILDAEVAYDNTSSGLSATTVKTAIDEVALAAGVGSPIALPSVIVSKVSHGLTTGDAIYFNGVDWAKARADNAVSIGYAVCKKIDDDTFHVYTNGSVSGLASLTPGAWYFVSTSEAGSLTTIEPTVSGFSNPIGVAISTTNILVLPMRAAQVNVNIVSTDLSSSDSISASSTSVLSSRHYDASGIASSTSAVASSDTILASNT